MPKGYPKAGRKWLEPSVVPSDLDLAWAAGIVDGEGCIMVKLSSERSGWSRHELMVNVTNTNEPMVRKLQAMFGGGLTIPKNYCKERRRNKAVWQIYGQRAGACLRQMLPYLVGKRDEAILGIEMAKTLTPKTAYNANSGMGAPRPPLEVVERRQEIREELQRLKRVEYDFGELRRLTQTEKA